MTDPLVYVGRKEVCYAAGLASCHYHYLDVAIRLKQLPAAKIEGQWMAPRHRVDTWAANQNRNPDDPIIKTPDVGKIYENVELIGYVEISKAISVGSLRLVRLYVEKYGFPAMRKTGMRKYWYAYPFDILRWLDSQIEITRKNHQGTTTPNAIKIKTG